jgi:hypothetical protein
MLTRSCTDYCEGFNESSSIDEDGDLPDCHLFCVRDPVPLISVVAKRNGYAGGEDIDD